MKQQGQLRCRPGCTILLSQTRASWPPAAVWSSSSVRSRLTSLPLGHSRSRPLLTLVREQTRDKAVQKRCLHTTCSSTSALCYLAGCFCLDGVCPDLLRGNGWQHAHAGGTRVLAPGASDTITLGISLDSLALTDYNGKRAAFSGALRPSHARTYCEQQFLAPLDDGWLCLQASMRLCLRLATGRWQRSR